MGRERERERERERSTKYQKLWFYEVYVWLVFGTLWPSPAYMV